VADRGGDLDLRLQHLVRHPLAKQRPAAAARHHARRHAAERVSRLGIGDEVLFLDADGKSFAHAPPMGIVMRPNQEVGASLRYRRGRR
jgi:hypothetical protein